MKFNPKESLAVKPYEIIASSHALQLTKYLSGEVRVEDCIGWTATDWLDEETVEEYTEKPSEMHYAEFLWDMPEDEDCQ